MWFNYLKNILSLINGELGGGLKETLKETGKIFVRNNLHAIIFAGMQKVILINIERII